MKIKSKHMKTNRLKLSGRLVQLTSFLMLTLLFARCTGPEGPMGPNGEDGLDGINYTRSVIYDIIPSDWEGDVDGYYAYLEVPEITNDIYYEGAVLVYRLFETEPKSFIHVPYTYVDGSLIVSMDFDAYVGSIDLIYKEVYEGINDTPAPSNDMAFKIVIIEGIPITTLKKMVDISNLSAVTKILNIDSEQVVVKSKNSL